MYDARLLLNVPEKAEKEKVSFAEIDTKLRSLSLQVRELNKGNIEATESQKEELFFDFLFNAFSIFQQIKDKECLQEAQIFLLPLIGDILRHFTENGVAVPDKFLESIK